MGLADNYDLCLNSTNITVDQAVDIIISYINICDSNKNNTHIRAFPEYTILFY